MKTFCSVIVGLLVVLWLGGCSKEPQKTVDAGTAKPASQVQQAASVGQIVEQSASQGSSSSGRKAAASIEKINAQKKSEE